MPYHHRHRRLVWAITLALLFFLGAGSLYWWRTPNITLTVDGKSRTLYARPGTVADLLKSAGVTLGPEDFAAPPLNTPLSHNMPIKVTRVKTDLETAEVILPPVIRWQSRTRTNLRRIRVQRGYSMRRRQAWRVTRYDGREVTRRLEKTKTVKRPLFTLTLYSDKGTPVKTYDLLKAKTMRMLATAYYVGDPMVPGDETRMGYKLERGLVAIDPRVIPLGTRLYIPGYGYAFAADTGSAIKGMRIDLAVKDAKEEAVYNHRTVTIYLLDRTKKW
jgi:3D (Asp-Asp-Asp) domain-containing protein